MKFLVAVSGGVEGFHYNKAMDMVEIGIGYAPGGGTTASGAGAMSGPGVGQASTTKCFH